VQPQMKIWNRSIACWVPKATHTLSEYVIIIGRENIHILGSVTFFRKSCHLRDNVEKYCRAAQTQMKIWNWSSACWAPKATLLFFHCNKMAPTRLIVSLYVHCLHYYN